jgi:hypothetical protein
MPRPLASKQAVALTLSERATMLHSTPSHSHIDWSAIKILAVKVDSVGNMGRWHMVDRLQYLAHMLAFA